MKCKCGCGEDCKKQYVHGHNRRKAVLNKKQREKMSNSHKGNKLSEETKKKISKAHIGKIISKKTRLKMRNQRLGKKHTEQTREKMRKMYQEGKILSKETREKISRAGIGRFFSEETRKKISLVHKGRKFSKEHKRKLKLHRATMILPTKDTLIEVKIQNFLKELGIKFLTHKHIKEIEHAYQCDILIPSINLIIECDGDYWHKYPIGRKIDHIRTSELLERGFKVLRLWEREIRFMKLSDFKNTLRKTNLFT